MKVINKTPNLFSSIASTNTASTSCLIIALSALFVHTSAAQTVDLGTFTASNIDSSSFINAGLLPGESFNGFAGEENPTGDGWAAFPAQSEWLGWQVNPFENTQIDSNLFDDIQFTIQVYTGQGPSDQFEEINSFYIQKSNDGQSFSDITSFDSLTTTGPTISSDASGLITSPDVVAFETQTPIVHSITFTADHSENYFRLVAPAGAVSETIFIINEVQTSAFAVPVPEPSTYALIFGLIAVGLITRKQRALKT